MKKNTCLAISIMLLNMQLKNKVIIDQTENRDHICHDLVSTMFTRENSDPYRMGRFRISQSSITKLGQILLRGKSFQSAFDEPFNRL